MSQLPLSTAVISTAGLTCKIFLNSGLCSITTSNLSALLDALQCKTRLRLGQGVVTVSNHLSTLDDPIMWGALPARTYLKSRTRRWVLGASDILFTNPVFSALFRNGQVIESFRGKGVFQPAVDTAVDKLNQGHWVHLFSEGRVCQPTQYPHTCGMTHLTRFKWGVGRIVMEANVMPLIIPMWLTGFDKLMPEGRPSPYKYFPKLGVKLGVAFGHPIPPERFSTLLDAPQHEQSTQTHSSTGSPSIEALHTPTIDEDHLLEHTTRWRQADRIRCEVTAIIQRAVEDLGRKISGDKLDGPLTR
ncbi:acyltransferase-domain-containing protein [Scleroderma yunnanense]